MSSKIAEKVEIYAELLSDCRHSIETRERLFNGYRVEDVKRLQSYIVKRLLREIKAIEEQTHPCLTDSFFQGESPIDTLNNLFKSFNPNKS